MRRDEIECDEIEWNELRCNLKRGYLEMEADEMGSIVIS